MSTEQLFIGLKDWARKKTVMRGRGGINASLVSDDHISRGSAMAYLRHCHASGAA